ncbi:MAG: DUF4236 domain-containing protein [Ruminococcus sp.]|jgi:hypothetical protein|nr:DUF4236 domain-containing protein [Ruminococcus sp.]
MGFHLRKSIKIGKLFKINKTKKGYSITIGGKNLRFTLNDKKKLTASLPGTGISYDTNLGKKDGSKKEKK